MTRFFSVRCLSVYGWRSGSLLVMALSFSRNSLYARRKEHHDDRYRQTYPARRASVETASQPRTGASWRSCRYARGDGPPAIVRFTCPEFTSLCPVTGQPDFAHIVIDYAPDALLVESKSLKLFMTSFRNHGAFHEDCTVMIGRRIVEATKPLWLRIAGYWFPRGGIPSTCSGRPARHPKAPGCPTPASRPIAGAAEPSS